MKKITIVALLIFFLFGCKTKHKITERKRVEKTEKTEAITKDNKINNITLDKLLNTSNNYIKVIDNNGIKLTQANESKIIVIDYGNGNKLTVKGADIYIFKNKTSETKKDTLTTKESFKDNSVQEKTNNSKTKTKSESQKRNSDSFVKTTSTWLWIFLSFLGLLVFLLFYLKR
jgi:ATP-dependent Zn protease